MSEELSRRRAIVVGGTVLCTGLAGCVGNGDDESSPAEREQAGDDNGLDDSDGSDAGGSSDGSAESGDDGTTGGADDGGETTGEDNGSEEDTDSVLFSDRINWDASHAVDLDYLDGEAEELTITQYQGNQHIVMSIGGMRGEVYRIDGTTYEILDGRCFIRSAPELDGQIPEIDDPSPSAPDIESSERTTIDGESVYVFEMPSEEGALWYISTETGYPVRFETPVYVARFHSWGETDPISPPEMSCQEI